MHFHSCLCRFFAFMLASMLAASAAVLAADTASPTSARVIPLVGWGSIVETIAPSVAATDVLPKPPPPLPGVMATELQKQEQATKQKDFEAAADAVLDQYAEAVADFARENAGKPLTWTLQVTNVSQNKDGELSVSLVSDEGGLVIAKFPADAKATLANIRPRQFVKISGKLSNCSLNMDAKDRYLNMDWPRFARRRLTVTLDAHDITPQQVSIAIVLDTSDFMHGGLVMSKAKPLLQDTINALGEKDRFIVFVASNDIKRLPANEMSSPTEKNRATVAKYLQSLGAGGHNSIATAISQAMSTVTVTAADIKLLVILAGQVDSRDYAELPKLLPLKPGPLRIQLWLNDTGLATIPDELRKRLEAAGSELRSYTK